MSWSDYGFPDCKNGDIALALEGLCLALEERCAAFGKTWTPPTVGKLGSIETVINELKSQLAYSAWQSPAVNPTGTYTRQFRPWQWIFHGDPIGNVAWCSEASSTPTSSYYAYISSEFGLDFQASTWRLNDLHATIYGLYRMINRIRYLGVLPSITGNEGYGPDSAGTATTKTTNTVTYVYQNPQTWGESFWAVGDGQGMHPRAAFSGIFAGMVARCRANSFYPDIPYAAGDYYGWHASGGYVNPVVDYPSPWLYEGGTGLDAEVKVLNFRDNCMCLIDLTSTFSFYDP